jgi:hypothetical protein
MDDARLKINENQHDELAGRVATLEAQVADLLKTLTRPAVLQRLGLDKYAFESGRAITAAPAEQSRQVLARMEALSQARSRNRSPTPSKRLTHSASSIATSSPRTSRCGPMAR